MLQVGLPRRFEKSVDHVEDGEQECPIDAGQRCRQNFRSGRVAGHDLDLVRK